MSADEEIPLRVGDHSVSIAVTAGARLSNWRVGDLELLARYSDAPVNWGMYPMAPWAGRLRDNTVSHPDATVTLPVSHDVWALHGTVLAATATVERVDRGPDEAMARLSFDEHGAWPWPIRVIVEYRLTSDVLTTVIEVQAERTSPAVVGWHPWFRRRLAHGEPAQWTLAAEAKAARGPDALPNGSLVPYDPDSGPFDDAFLVPDGRASITWPGALTIDIDWDGPWCVVFDELAPALCLEPQSGPPDGVNDGLGRPLTVAAPGRPHRLVTHWRLRPSGPPGDRG